MIEIYKFEGKTKEACLKEALTKLNVKEEEIEVRESEKTGLFKSKKCEVEIILKKDIKEAIKSFLKELAEQMNIVVNMEINEKDSGFYVVLASEKNSILIGKEGRTLTSIQTILKKYLMKISDFDIKINLDISNYKAKIEKNFEYEIKKIAKDVLSTGVDAKLEPMNSYKRRIVHTIVSEFNNLETESLGEGLERHVIIRYKENA